MKTKKKKARKVKSRKTKTIQFETTEIGPVEASRIIKEQLDLGNRNPRAINKKRIAELSYDMSAGEWKAWAADPIKFDEAGHLIDGWHRLYAIIDSRKKISVVIFRDVPRDTRHAINAGRSMSLGIRLKNAGLVTKYASQVAGFLRLLNYHVTNPTKPLAHHYAGTSPTFARAALLLKKIKLEDLFYASKVSVSPDNVARSIEFIYVFYCALQEDRDRAQKFFNSIAYPKRRMRGLARKVVNYFAKLREYGRVPQEVKMNALLYGWHLYKNGANPREFRPEPDELGQYNVECPIKKL